jgi:DNA-binding HxlR family transcriptional regulator
VPVGLQDLTPSCDLGISRKVLAERLKWLMAQGVLEQRVYSERPLRHEYLLTEKGVGARRRAARDRCLG